MLHGADYLARLMLCHFACFNNQSNKIRVYRAILLPCYSLNLPRVSPGWCKSLFFSVRCNQLEAPEIKVCSSSPVLSLSHTIQLLFYFFPLPPFLFLTEHPLQQIPCVSVITAESRGTPWYWLRKGPSAQSWHKPRSKLKQTPSPVPSALMLHCLRVCNVSNITPSLVKTLDPHPPKKQCMQNTLLSNYSISDMTYPAHHKALSSVEIRNN